MRSLTQIAVGLKGLMKIYNKHKEGETLAIGNITWFLKERADADNRDQTGLIDIKRFLEERTNGDKHFVERTQKLENKKSQVYNPIRS